MKYGFGVDLGGTTVKIGLFTDDGKMVESFEIPTDKTDNGKNVLSDINKAVQDKIEEKGIAKKDVAGIGIGVPGPVTPDGVVHKLVNIGWGDVEIEKDLSELSGFPVKAGNDANVAALGEAWVGAGKQFKSICMVTLGTGIGGGLIVNGKILTGSHGAGAEIGHIVINPDEPESCGCGLHGCAEMYGSATGVVRVARRHIKNNGNNDSPIKKAADKPEFCAKDVFDAARFGDSLAMEIVSDVCDKLGRTLAIVSAVSDPDAFIIGGGVSKAGDILIRPLEEAFKKYAFHACRETKIVSATLENDAGMYGCAKLIFDA